MFFCLVLYNQNSGRTAQVEGPRFWLSAKLNDSVHQRCTNSWLLVVRPTKFCKVVLLKLWVLRKGLLSNHTSDTHNFQVVHRFLENVCTPGV